MCTVCVREAPRGPEHRACTRQLLGLQVCPHTRIADVVHTASSSKLGVTRTPVKTCLMLKTAPPAHSGTSPTGHCPGLQDRARLAPREEEVLHKKPSENSGEKEKECAVSCLLEEQVQPESFLHASPGDRPAWPCGWPCAHEEGGAARGGRGCHSVKRKPGLGASKSLPPS